MIPNRLGEHAWVYTHHRRSVAFRMTVPHLSDMVELVTRFPECGRAVSGRIHVPEMSMPEISVTGNQCLHTSFEGRHLWGLHREVCHSRHSQSSRVASVVCCTKAFLQPRRLVLPIRLGAGRRLSPTIAWGVWRLGNSPSPSLRAIDLTHPCGIRHKSSLTPRPSCLSVGV
jgi:hypothetical protein